MRPKLISKLLPLSNANSLVLGNSGATPRRRQTQAVRPRDDASRKGMPTKRGNADQERERAPREGKGNRE
ncbi:MULTISPECIES: hypothetical protein [Okeania]|uniref:hypothetical protein n=1 Tax=Okeania TaxID=1458928 RepID=UPI000F541DC0|nr:MULTISPECIES: hypothetical protein [Okeania]NET14159.1 hypothetical protein [Okeania sp. SIO1H6]NEP89239.1 hypothetical protein [Okeania sp. SIO2C2]NES75158.1 hypothetical protein [Okeania sp. SIO1H4]NES91116.1 hypothetical protein [Okeania sp. SIO2B9]NET21113.1 hypothetical protein [Okeania sp. SIO1H5]